jgi:hypothetical protein
MVTNTHTPFMKKVNKEMAGKIYQATQPMLYNQDEIQSPET